MFSANDKIKFMFLETSKFVIYLDLMEQYMHYSDLIICIPGHPERAITNCFLDNIEQVIEAVPPEHFTKQVQPSKAYGRITSRKQQFVKPMHAVKSSLDEHDDRSTFMHYTELAEDEDDPNPHATGGGEDFGVDIGDDAIDEDDPGDPGQSIWSRSFTFGFTKDAQGNNIKEIILPIFGNTIRNFVGLKWETVDKSDIPKLWKVSSFLSKAFLTTDLAITKSDPFKNKQIRAPLDYFPDDEEAPQYMLQVFE